MRATAKTLTDFVRGFGLPAYTLNTVPDDINHPYLTYPLTEPEWNQKTTFYIQGWYKTTSNTELLKKADQIVREIGTGVTIGANGGYLVIYPETPLVQVLVNGDWRSFYINLSINSYHMPGYFPEEGD